jgi:ubiquinone/menaquinone biosynthesis C-methylase UbiE
MPLHVAAVRREYDRLAPEYDRRWNTYIDSTLTGVLEALTLAGGERILDVACGTGELERRLLDRWPRLRVIGADLSLEMLRRAEVKPVAGDVSWLQAEAGALPFADGAFDWALCANSFHYFRNPLESLRELLRVLRPGGRLLIVDWCDDFLACRICSLWLRWTDPAFYRMYTLQECRSLLTDAGALVESSKRFRCGWIWGLQRLISRPVRAVGEPAQC